MRPLSLICSSLEDEVLLRAGYCGVFSSEQAFINNFTDYKRFVQSYLSGKVANSANYAQECYSDSDTSGSLDCAGFVMDRIPSIVNNTANCPFSSDRCRSNTTNLFVSTSLIDTHDAFGLNSPSDERVLFRSSLHCSPLITQGHTSSHQSAYGNFTRYHYGSNAGQFLNSTQSKTEGTFEIKDVETQYGLDASESGSEYPISWKSYPIN